MESTTQLSLRIEFGEGERLGPGKVALLERIKEHGSISAAARTMDMSYRRAWLLVESMNGLFGKPTVQTRIGREDGGGAVLTPFGERLVHLYRLMERRSTAANQSVLAELKRARTRAAPTRGAPRRRAGA